MPRAGWNSLTRKHPGRAELASDAHRASKLVQRLGTVGHIAKGVVIVGVGVLVVAAASRPEPNKADLPLRSSRKLRLAPL